MHDNDHYHQYDTGQFELLTFNSGKLLIVVTLTMPYVQLQINELLVMKTLTMAYTSHAIQSLQIMHIFSLSNAALPEVLLPCS